MAKLSLGLVSSIFVLLFISASVATLESPFIVAHKKVSLSRLKSGAEQVVVTVDVYNKGSTTAYDVSLSDETWSEDIFDLVSGNTSRSWERLDVDVKASHNFILQAKKKGLFRGAPAVVKYRVPSKAAVQEAYSTPVHSLHVLEDRPPEKKLELTKRLLAKHGSLLSVLLIIILFGYVLTRPSKPGLTAKVSKKKR